MNELMRTQNHSYTVELRFSAASLVPCEISRRLCLQPTKSSDDFIDSPKYNKRRPFWAYNGEGMIGFQAEWQSLEEGLNFLLRQLASVQPIIIELSQSFEGVWWCGHFQASFDGGPTLSSKILSEVAGYKLPLFIDNYFASEP